MSEVPLLVTLIVALTAAFIGGVLVRRLGLPPVIGYVLAGVAIGPFTPGFVSDAQTINQLAELGVIFLLFGVGLHLALGDLWSVRAAALPGALLRMVLIGGIVVAISWSWGWSLSASLILGIAASIASTVILLRGLTDQGLLLSSPANMAIGWLVVEDLATVLLLVILPILAPGDSGDLLSTTAQALLKTALFAVLMIVAGTRVLPWFLLRIAHTRSRELFLLAVVVVTLGTALGAAEFFGVSLALGAFLAGVVLSESALSAQIGAEIAPFRDIFAVLFFVSVGQLVNPLVVWQQAGALIVLIAVIVIGKALVTLLLGLVLPMGGRTALVVALGSAQIGEFSFIVGQTGVQLKILTAAQYTLLLAAAAVSIVLNPFLWRTFPWLERSLRRQTWLWRRLDHAQDVPEVSNLEPQHVVVVGVGRVGQQILTILRKKKVACLVVELDPRRAMRLTRQGIPTLLGDAANSDLLEHAHLPQARALVITVPDEAAAEVIVATGRSLAAEVHIIVRAATRAGIDRLQSLGANEVIQPELEGSRKMVEATLLELGFTSESLTSLLDTMPHETSSSSSA